MDLPIFLKCLFLMALVFNVSNGLPNKNNSSNYFDVIIFTQLFPETVCFDLKQTLHLESCNIPPKKMWTIHGIWPTKYHTYKPENCNESLNFDASQFSKYIADQLEKNWLFVANKTHPEQLWKHEWDKHGTCSTGIGSVSTQTKYFEKGLALFKKYNADKILQKARIFPGNNYSVQTILSRVDKILGVRSYIDCVKHKQTQKQYFHEVRICFDKFFNITSCEGILNFPSNCDPSKVVIYP